MGKIAVDNAILPRPQLNDAEFAQMKVHPERGADLLRDVKFLHPIIPYCLYHHERWDGNGYPFRLKGRIYRLGVSLPWLTLRRHDQHPPLS